MKVPTARELFLLCDQRKSTCLIGPYTFTFRLFPVRGNGRTLRRVTRLHIPALGIQVMHYYSPGRYIKEVATWGSNKPSEETLTLLMLAI